MIRFIGDIHADFKAYKSLVRTDCLNIQVGDFGVGFETVPKMASNELFLRGNHDNPSLCRLHPNYIGEWGYSDDLGWLCGAASVDKDLRIPGLDWWADEELSMQEMTKALEVLCYRMPKVMVTHDCPKCISGFESLTGNALDLLFSQYKPKLWIYGHHHKTSFKTVEGCQFVCVGTNQHFDVDGLNYESIHNESEPS